MTTPVVPLASRRALDRSLTGGKGASLAQLLRAGFPVPPGFVITTTAVRDALNTARRLVAGDGQGANGRAAGLQAARRHCLEWAPTGRLARAIFTAHRKLACARVAVRSSLVCEDSHHSSCAGLLDTVLDVPGQAALVDAIRTVLASAFGERLWTYLDDAGLDARGASFSLAIVVQEMIPAAVSGVAFSVDPVTCAPGVVIEAVPGLGEALVQGRALPDRYRFGPRGELSEAHPANPGAPLLDEAAAGRLAKIIARIADFAGTPQDVEWSQDDRGLHVLQARPITTIAGKTVYSRRMVSDMAPGLVKPLVWSAKYAPIVGNVFAPLFEGLAGPTGVDYRQMSARFYSRVYMNVTAFGELFARIGLPPNFFYVLAREDRAAPGKPRFRARMLPALFRLGRFVRRESRIERRVQPFLDSQNRALDVFRTIDWASQPPEALLAHFGRLKGLHGRSQWYVVLVSINMLARNRLLGRMIARRWPGTDPREVINGYGRRSSLVPFEEIRKLADLARPLGDSLLERMACGPGTDLAGALEATEGGRRLLAQFDAFMGRFGFLSANGSDFSEAPWVESPRLVWNAIGRLAASDTLATPGDAEARREEVLAVVRGGFGPLRRRLFDHLHASTVRYMQCRDRVSLLMTEESFLMRRCLLALGQRLCDRGMTEHADDVFFLFEEELAAAFGEHRRAGADLRGTVAERTAELAAHAALDAPETLCGGELPVLEPPTAEGLEFLSGIGASAGVIEGRARVVREPGSSSGGLGPTDILIVPFTDIGWIPLLAGVGGVVADTGGQLSHTSILAREFGIPAVVSVRNATRLIPDGRRLTIDGTSGRVYLHPEPHLKGNPDEHLLRAAGHRGGIPGGQPVVRPHRVRAGGVRSEVPRER